MYYRFSSILLRNCIIGNSVTLRYDTIIARGVEIGDGTYVCPRVMTNNLNTSKSQIGGAKIGKNCFIGTNAVLQHGINIGDNVVIGSLAFINKDCEENSTYIGIPGKSWKINIYNASIKKIAEFLNIKSNNSSVIQSLTNQSDDGSLRLSWAKDELNLKKINSGAVICNRETFNKIEPVKDVEYLIVDNPRLAFAIVVNEFFDFIPDYFTNLHSIHRGNEKVRIGSNVFIGKNVVLGEGCIIHDNVSIYPNSFIGKNCVIKSFASIGTEGLGQEFDSRINAYVKFPQIGGVEIGDNVEIVHTQQ